MKYISKDALVVEIESLKSAAETMLTGKTDLSYWKAQKYLCERFLYFIDTLEVKEVEEEPVSDELEEEALVYSASDTITEDGKLVIDSEKVNAFKAGAKWQKKQFEKDYTNLCKGIATAKGLAVTMAYDTGMADARKQMMANTADAMIGLPYENKDGGYTHLIDVSRPLPVGNNKIAIIFKEE